MLLGLFLRTRPFLSFLSEIKYTLKSALGLWYYQLSICFSDEVLYLRGSGICVAVVIHVSCTHVGLSNVQLNSHIKHPQGEQQLPTGNLKFHALTCQMFQPQPCKFSFACGSRAGPFLHRHGQVNRRHSSTRHSTNQAFNELVKSLMLQIAINRSASRPTTRSALPWLPFPPLPSSQEHSLSIFNVKKNSQPRSDNNLFSLSLCQFFLTGKCQHAPPVPPSWGHSTL